MGDAPPKFGFVVHPLTPFQRRLYGVRTLDRRLANGRPPPPHDPDQPDTDPARILSRFTVADPHGGQVEGVLVGVPLLPEDMLTDQQGAVSAVRHAVARCHREGASVVGLGAVAAVIGGQGKAVAAEAPCPITTGNTFTAVAAFQTWRLWRQQAGYRGPVALMGAPGPVAGGILRMLAADGAQIDLIAPKPSTPLKRLADEIAGPDQIRWCPDPYAVLAEGTPLIAASSTGGRLSRSALPPGAIIIDVAAPVDVLPDGPPREDVLILDGEYVRLPRLTTGVQFWRRIYGWVTGQRAHVFACFAEPMVLALSGHCESLSLGRHVAADQLRRMEALALHHGFWVDQLFEGGRPVDQGRLERFSRR